jgi:hypothetical protein
MSFSFSGSGCELPFRALAEEGAKGLPSSTVARQINDNEKPREPGWIGRLPRGWARLHDVPTLSSPPNAVEFAFSDLLHGPPEGSRPHRGGVAQSRVSTPKLVSQAVPAVGHCEHLSLVSSGLHQGRVDQVRESTFPSSLSAGVIASERGTPRSHATLEFQRASNELPRGLRERRVSYGPPSSGTRSIAAGSGAQRIRERGRSPAGRFR